MLDQMYTAKVTVSAAQASGFTVECGFVPKYVKIWNVTTPAIIEWADTMDDDDYFGSDDTAGTTGFAFNTSGGITKVTGDQNNPQGFSIANGLCTENDVLHILAIRA